MEKSHDETDTIFVFWSDLYTVSYLRKIPNSRIFAIWRLGANISTFLKKLIKSETAPSSQNIETFVMLIMMISFSKKVRLHFDLQRTLFYRSTNIKIIIFPHNASPIGTNVCTFAVTISLKY